MLGKMLSVQWVSVCSRIGFPAPSAHNLGDSGRNYDILEHLILEVNARVSVPVHPQPRTRFAEYLW